VVPERQSGKLVSMDNGHARVVARVEGGVQGVGFRWFVQRVAGELGLAGSATNLPDGSVEVVAEGPRATCDDLVETLRSRRPPGHVSRVAVSWNAPTGMHGFRTG
jgi:acylphosphatase